MKKILFVEDDALIARIYSQKLAEVGFDVAVAEDGIAATQRLLEFKPDLMVLDLLMPKMSGSDVLKFMREQPELKTVRVIVFSNSFLTNLVEQVTSISMKVDAALVKADVTPARLVEVINKVLAGATHAWVAPNEPGAFIRDPGKPEPPAKTSAPPAPINREPELKFLRPRAPASVPPPPAPPASKEPPPIPTGESDIEFVTRMGRQFLERSPIIFKDLRQICREFLEAEDPAIQSDRLVALNRKVGFLTQMTGFAGYHRTAELSSALEALLFELLNKPESINDSSRQTVASTIAFLAHCFDSAAPAREPNRPPAGILVVDDDVVTNRALVEALGRAKLHSTSLTDPLEALKMLEQVHYDLVLLDVSMPGMDGTALCEQMRLLPRNKRTPVIFVTSHSDFKTRAQSILSGGNDLITKPISPTELCVKVITHLQKNG